MNIEVFENDDELAKRAYKLIKNQVCQKPESVIGFATGASPVKTYQNLIRGFENGEVSFAKMRTFNLDEYVSLKRDDKNSYYYFMQENLFSHIDVKESNIHFLSGTADDENEECKRYERQLCELGLDLQILGIGTNGHIGFNEPSDRFTREPFVVSLTKSTIESNKKYFEEGKMPKSAVTMGVGDIMRAKSIILIATGAKKAEAIKKTVMGDVTPMVPASVLQFHRNTTLLLDKEAASLLER